MSLRKSHPSTSAGVHAQVTQKVPPIYQCRCAGQFESPTHPLVWLYLESYITLKVHPSISMVIHRTLHNSGSLTHLPVWLYIKHYITVKVPPIHRRSCTYRVKSLWKSHTSSSVVGCADRVTPLWKSFPSTSVGLFGTGYTIMHEWWQNNDPTPMLKRLAQELKRKRLVSVLEKSPEEEM